MRTTFAFAPTPLHTHTRARTQTYRPMDAWHDIGLNCVSHQVYSPRLNIILNAIDANAYKW